MLYFSEKHPQNWIEPIDCAIINVSAAIELTIILRGNKMSTSSLITLHNISAHSEHGFKTASFYRHHDSANAEIMGDMFYNMFNVDVKGSAIEALIIADPKNVVLFNLKDYSIEDCEFEFHYHLDMKTLNLVVLNRGSKVFDGLVDQFINQYTKQIKAVVSHSEYKSMDNNEPRLTVFTRESLIRKMNNHVVSISNLKKSTCKTNPNFKVHISFLNRADCILSEMNLLPEHQRVQSIIQELVTTYEEMMFA